VTRGELENALKTEKTRLFIDLAVPPDIDPDIKSATNMKLINIDNLKETAKENNALKLDSVSQAKEIISCELDLLKKELAFHQFLPQLQRVKQSLAEKSTEEIIYTLKAKTDSEDFSAFLKCLELAAELENKPKELEVI
jgi:glutamyl-tRNA reductase